MYVYLSILNLLNVQIHLQNMSLIIKIKTSKKFVKTFLFPLYMPIYLLESILNFLPTLVVYHISNVSRYLNLLQSNFKSEGDNQRQFLP